MKSFFLEKVNMVPYMDHLISCAAKMDTMAMISPEMD